MAYDRKRHFVIGLIILIAVDLIWVLSSEFTKFIFNDSGYNKPYFSTYLKTSLFSLYLLGFVCRKSWRAQCIDKNETSYENLSANSDDDCSAQETSSLGEPVYEPLKSGEQERGGESDESSSRLVRFSKMAEVRHMSEGEASEAMFSRLSFNASLRVEEILPNLNEKFSVRTVMKISLIFCLIWFLGNFGYQKALSVSEVGLVNVISSTSSLFTLILAAIFPTTKKDKFTLSKLVAVFVMVGGITVISLENVEVDKSSVPQGLLWALIGAVFYAVYMVFIRKSVPSDSNMDFSMFFGFVGIFNAFILWPGLFLFSAVGWESFELPSKQQLLYIVVNGLVGTVLSDLLWLWGCFLTSSLIATLSMSLTIPMSMLCDRLLKGVSYSWRFYAGAGPVFASFIAVSVLTHFDDIDPVWDLCCYFSSFCCSGKRSYGIVLEGSDAERDELLVSSEEKDDESSLEKDELENGSLTDRV